MVPSCRDGKMMTNIEILKFPLGGQRNIVAIWIQLRLLTSHIPRWSERSRYENNLALGVNDGAKPGPTTCRDDFSRAVRTVGAIKDDEGRMNPYIPKHLRERQRPFDEKLRSDLEWQSWNWNVNWSQRKMTRTTTRRMARSAMWQRGKYSLFDPSVILQDSCTFVRFFFI